MINKVILQGRLTRDPEIRQTPSGTTCAKFSLATNSGYKSKDGQEITTYTDCVAWGKTGEFVSKFFFKGSEMLIEGELRNNNYTDKNGTNHYGMNVNVSSVNFCGTKSGQAQQPQQTAQQAEREILAQQAQVYSQIGHRDQAQGFVQQAQAQGVPTQQVPDIGDLGEYEVISGDVPF